MKHLVRLGLPLVAALLSGCAAEAPTDTESVPPVVLTMEAVPQASELQSFVGVVSARNQIAYAFGVTGVLTSRSVTVGESVEAGQVLAALDSRSLQLALSQAQAGLSSAQAQAQAVATSLQRTQQLQNLNQVSQSQVEAATQQAAAAQAGVAQAQAEVASAEQQLELATLRATSAGVVTEIGAEPGQIMPVGQPIVTVARPDTRDILIDVPEMLASELEIGAEFDVVLQMDNAITAEGLLREVAPQVNATTRMRQLVLELRQPPEAFWLGTTAIATLRIDDDTASLAVPAHAVFEADGDESVYIVDPATSTLTARKITAAPGPTDDWVIVEDGLERGELVVRIGVEELHDGQAVRLESHE